MTDESRQAYQASTRLSRAAGELMQSSHGLDRPSDSHAVLGNVLDAMRTLESVLGQLAEWHRSAEAGRHFHEGHDDSAICVMTVIAELDLAQQQADGRQETISRANGGNAVVRRFDEVVRPDET